MGSSAKFGKFKWSRPGYTKIMNSSGVQGELERKAQAVKHSADSLLSDGGYRYEGHEVNDVDGIMAKGKAVRTKTDQARSSNAKHNTLLKALGSAR